MVATVYSATHPDLEVPLGGSLEIIAPVQSEMTEESEFVDVFGYRVRIDEQTRFEKGEGEIVRRYPMDNGEWVDLRARMTAEGVLLADRIRRIKKRPLFVRIQQQGSDTFAFPEATNPTGIPLKALIEDEAKGVAFRFHPAERLLIGGKIGQRLRLQDDRDLLNESNDNELGLRTDTQVDLLWQFLENGSFVLIEPQGSLDIRWQQDGSSEYDSRLRLARANVLLGLGDVVVVQLGRQDFVDDRQWFYDEVLDGVRLLITTKRFVGEIGWSTGRELADGLNKTIGFQNVNLELRWRFTKNHFISGWFVEREDSIDANFNPRLAGLRWVNRPKTGFRHWVDVAAASGEVGGETIQGFGADIGVNYVAKKLPRPYGVMALAYGSGAEGKSQDTAFRQSGLQGNSDKFGGISRYNYYGEVFEPELSNRAIASVGLGIKPNANFSIDAMWHGYRQVEITKDLGETRLKTKPNGDSADLGMELDIVFSARYQELTVDLLLGLFKPGAAFDREDTTHLGEFEVEFKF